MPRVNALPKLTETISKGLHGFRPARVRRCTTDPGVPRRYRCLFDGPSYLPAPDSLWVTDDYITGSGVGFLGRGVLVASATAQGRSSRWDFRTKPVHSGRQLDQPHHRVCHPCDDAAISASGDQDGSRQLTPAKSNSCEMFFQDHAGRGYAPSARRDLPPLQEAGARGGDDGIRRWQIPSGASALIAIAATQHSGYLTAPSRPALRGSRRVLTTAQASRAEHLGEALRRTVLATLGGLAGRVADHRPWMRAGRHFSRPSARWAGAAVAH